MRRLPNLIGIAGPSCAGKGELCQWLARQLHAPVLPLDSYYRPLDHLSPAERAASNFDEPAALDDELLVSHLQLLARGRAIDVPEYDFARHTRSPYTRLLEPASFVLVEGLFTLYWPAVRGMLAASIFITASDQVCLARRLARDQIERGRSAESVIQQYHQTVQPMRQLHVDPSRVFAGLVLDGTRAIEENGESALGYVARSVNLAAAASA